jgi:hypothetical protein
MQTDPIQIMLEVIDKNLADLDKASAGLGNLNKSTDQATKSNDSLGSSIEGSVTKYFSYAAALSVAEKAIQFTIDAWNTEVAAATEDEAAISRLNATIQSTGRAGQISAAQIGAMGTSLHGLYDSAAFANAANILLKFVDIPSERIPNDLILIENMASSFGGLEGAAQAYGMALETGRTRGMGFSKAITAQINELFKLGEVEKAGIIITDELTKKYSGQAAAALGTLDGKTTALKTAQGELNSTIGNFWLPLLKTKTDLELVTIKGIQRWTEMLWGLKPAINNVVLADTELDKWTQKIASSTELATQGWATSDFTLQQLNPTVAALAKHMQSVADTTVLAAEDYGAQLNAIVGYASIYDQNTKDMAKAEGELATLRKAGWGEHSKKVQDAIQNIKDLQTAEDEQTNKWMADMLLQKLSVGGLNDTEFAYYLDYMVRTGQMTVAAENHAKAEWDTVNAIAALADKTVTVTINTNYTGSPPPGTSVNPAPSTGPTNTPAPGGQWVNGHYIPITVNINSSNSATNAVIDAMRAQGFN